MQYNSQSGSNEDYCEHASSVSVRKLTIHPQDIPKQAITTTRDDTNLCSTTVLRYSLIYQL